MLKAHEPVAPVAAVEAPRASLPMLVLLFALFGFPLLIGIAQGGAKLYQTSSDVQEVILNPPRMVTLLKRLGMLVEPFLCCAALFYTLATRGTSPPSRLAGRIWLSFAAFWAAETGRCFIINPIDVVINPRYWYSMLLATTFFVVSPFPYATLFRIFQAFVWLTTWGSFVLLKIAPTFVSAPSSTLVFDRLDFRLHGPFCHANHFAYMLAVYLLLPRPRSDAPVMFALGRKLLDAGVVAAFVFAQSKTLYVLLPVALCAKFFTRFLPERGPLRSAIVVSALLILGSFAFIQISGGGLASQLFGWTSIRTDTLESLTGRREVWNAMLSDWEQKPFIGYGASTWKDEGTYTVRWGKGNNVAAHAHSQIVQSLWETGIVGLATLLVHVVVLVFASTKVVAWMQPGLIATMLLVTARMITETSLSIMYYDDIQIVVYMVLLLTMMTAAKLRSEAMAQA
jgi:O-antigen ligase